MEILNNIWIALTTENPILMKWILLLMFVENYLSLHLFLSILNISSTRKQRILYIFLFSIEGIISMLFIPSPFNLIFNYVISFLMIFIIFKLKPLKVILCIILPVIIFALVGSLISNPYLRILNISHEQYETIPIYKLGYLCIMYISIFLIIKLIKRKNLKINILEDLDNKTKMIIICNFILGLFVLCVQLIINSYFIDNLPILITFLNFISLLAYFFVSIYSLTRVTKLSITQKELESSESYNKSLSILHDNIRGFKHDFDNIVATIGGYVKTNDMEGLKKYYYELDVDCQRVNNLTTLNPETINNPAIYGILASKYLKADELGIQINLEVFLNLNKINMKIYEFSTILGILLDNAIEAASECEEKVINIKFRNEQSRHRHVVIIENTFKDNNLDIEEMFQKGVSGKQNHSGLGLWEIRQILKKNNNLNLHTEKSKNLFKQQLEIYY